MSTEREIVEFVNGLKVGERCNVRHDSRDVPMVREITDTGIEARKDGEWIIWRWKREGTTPEGRMDCGYSGYRISAAQQAAA